MSDRDQRPEVQPSDVRGAQEVAREAQVGRRSSARVTIRVAGELVLGEEAFTVLLTEVSHHGARLYMPVPPAAGRRGVLCWGANEQPCTVLWAGPDSLGVSFDTLLPDAEVIAARTSGRGRASAIDGPVWPSPQIPPRLHRAKPAERRRSGRSDLRLDCEIRQGDDPWLPVTLENVSREGFRLAWFAGCQTVQPLTLRLPDGAVLQAAIDRRDDYRIACRFVRPIEPAAFAAMIGE